ncbi:hypothetical protein PG984_009871 [Apiospora sp. TS-2023a]
MAEILGAVASGISIAQFAGIIIKTSFRIKNLLEEMKEIPQELQRHLAQIQILAPLLVEIDHGPSISNGALIAAAEQCRQAALELDAFATELSHQLQSSKGSTRRFRSFQVVLQKNTLASHEKRVHATMQMLMLALQLTSLCRQNELIQLQQSQPGIIAAEVIGSLDIARRAGHPLVNEQGTGTETLGHQGTFKTPGRADVAAINRLGLFQPTTTIGLEWLTGSVQFGSSKCATAAGNKTGRDEETISYGFRLRFPRWLSGRALDSLLYKSSISWNHILIPYCVRELNSDAGTEIRRIIAKDDVEGLRMSLQSGDVAIRDRFIQNNMEWTDETGKLAKMAMSGEETLFSLAVSTGAWKIGSFLEEMGIAQQVYSIISSAWHNEDASAYHRRHLLQRLDELFPTRVSLGCFSGTIDEFQILRRTFWPDSQFFHESFTDTRDKVAASIAMTPPWGSANHSLLQCEKLRHILLHPEVIRSKANACRLTRTLGRVAKSIGQATFEGDTSVIRGWTDLWTELTDAYLANEFDDFLRDASGPSFGKPRRHPLAGWLSMLLEGVRQGILHHHPNRPTRPRHHTHHRFDKGMNQAIRVFLDMLQTRRVDLVLLHKAEMLEWEAYVEHWDLRSAFIDTEYLTLHYIGITHGPNPEDWRFWSADNAESYAGDFGNL